MGKLKIKKSPDSSPRSRRGSKSTGRKKKAAYKALKVTIHNPFKSKRNAPTPVLKGIKMVKPTPRRSSKKKQKNQLNVQDVTPIFTNRKVSHFKTTPTNNTSTPNDGRVTRSGAKKYTPNFGRKKGINKPSQSRIIPPSPATIIRSKSGMFGQGSPIIVDQTINLEDKQPKTKLKKAKLDVSKEDGEITISSDDDDEIQIVGEKLNPLPVLSRLNPSPSIIGFHQFRRNNMNQRSYPAMGLRASSRSKLGSLLGQPPPDKVAKQPATRMGARGTRTKSAISLPESLFPTVSDSTQMPNLIDGSQGKSTEGSGLRPIVIDGSNVAVQHALAKGLGAKFSCRGIDICVQYFKNRGHEVTVFVPQYRTKSGMAEDRQILEKLHRQGILSYTPSKSYDDRFVIQYAATCGGVIVSNDNYKDVKHESSQVRLAVDQRLLKFTWVKDTLMFPTDPLGKYKPKLEQMLRF